MKNCRNCKHAEWKTVNGRRNFNYWAACKAPIDLTQFPASAHEVIKLLEKPLKVASHDNVPVDCNRWEKP